MPRSPSSARHQQSPGPRRARWLHRTAIVSIALGSLLAITTGIVHAQVDPGGAQAAGAIGVAGEEAQVVACKLQVPPHALTAKGLATPWVLSGDQGGKCEETTPDQAAFIDATIFDPATGKVSIYRPLVVTEGTTPAAAPVPPPLPNGAVVEISVGFNGDELTATDGHRGQDIADARCVNGLGDSIFGQEIFCNASAFYRAANRRVTLTPPLGTSPDDGRPCPTTESWEIVDQDQSDNTTTNYLVRGNQTAQNTAANRGDQGGEVIGNGSDNNLYTNFYGPAVHCQPPQAPDLTDPRAPVRSTSSALLNLYARKFQSAPAALVPLGDPFTTVNGEPSLRKTNLYRAQVDQPPAPRAQDASTATYCRNLLDRGLSKIELDKAFLQGFGRSPDPAVSDDLHLFILNRFKESWDNLGCEEATGTPNPVTVTTDADGRVLRAEVASPTSTTAGSSSSSTTTTSTTTADQAAGTAPTTTAGQAAAGTPTTAADQRRTATTAPPTTALSPASAATPTTASPAVSPAVAPTTAVSTASPAASPAVAPTTAVSTASPASPAVAPTTGRSASPAAAPTTAVSTASAASPSPAAVAGLAEGARQSFGVGSPEVSNARPAGALPFTGADSRVLFLAAALLLGAGGLLLLWAGSIRRGQLV